MRASFPRRTLLAGTVGATAAGCGFFSTDKDPEEDSAASDSAAKESPMLAEQVEAGTLPPLEKRLPTNPMVVKTWKENGVHGGTIRRALTDPADSNGGINTISRVGLAEFDLHTYEPVPALAESWQLGDGGKSLTVKLRKGLKWSDGEPFTTDDLEFYFESIIGNETLSPAPPTWFVVEGKTGTFTKIDETSFTLDFVGPHALLVKYLAFASIASQMVYPKHYLAQFHPDHTDQGKLTAAAKKASYPTWDQYFAAKNDIWLNPDRPVMGAWKVKEATGGTTNHATLERNPFYWKVDTDGRQLPYVDTVSYDIMDASALILRAANGAIDLQNRWINYSDATVLLKNADEHNYTVLRWPTDAPWYGLYMNQSHKDPAVRALMQNRDFRAAMSHAINRDEIDQTLFIGQGNTANPGPIAEDDYHVSDYGKTFVEHDPDRANDLLDSIGLDQRDADDWRLRPDGEVLDLTILTFDFANGAQTDAFEMVTRYWRDVGVKASVKTVSTELWGEQVRNGDADIPGYLVAGYSWDIDAEWYVPIADICYWAPVFGTWYATGGDQGEEPPEEIRWLQRKYDELKVTIDVGKRIEIGREIIRRHNENVYMIGTTGTPFQPVVASKDLVNVREEAVSSYRLCNIEVTWFEQVFYRNPEDH